MSDFPMPLVAVDWLTEHLGEPDLVILDASWHLPAKERSGQTEFAQQRLAGARFFDYDGAIKDQQSPLPRMMPGPELFENEVRRLGISNASRIVIYDTNGMFAAPRAWWMFQAMGHPAVSVLDGGLAAWIDAGHELETGDPVTPSPGDFTAKPVPDAFVDRARVRQALDENTTLVLDARAGERFRAAHMPTADNLPYSDLLANGRFRDPATVTKLIKDHVTDDQQVVCSCGSGVTACVLALGATLAGHQGGISVYDGSWSEWGAAGDLPIVSDTETEGMTPAS